MHLPLSLLSLLFYTLPIAANVEKTIFLAPEPVLIPALSPNLDDLGLQRLSPSTTYLRTQLNVSFPTADTVPPDGDSDSGTDTWFFLENLTPGQRYEVRICWLATQPTTFTLTTYHPHTTIETPSLLTSLTLYSNARLASLAPIIPHSDSAPHDPTLTTDSVLFLRVRATADYFSLDRKLMETAPPVVVDLVLDPFLGNVFPRSLVPTAGWVVAVCVLAGGVAWGLVGEVGRLVRVSGGEGRSEGRSEGKKVR